MSSPIGPKLAFPLFVAASLSVATTPARAEAQGVGNPIILRLAGPSEERWEVLSPAGERTCQLPCELHLDGRAGWSVRRVPVEPYAEPESIPFPDTAKWVPGTTLDAKLHPKTGSVLGAGILTGVSASTFAVGLGIILAGGCAGYDGPSRPSACLTGIALMPIGLAGALAGGIWLLLSHSGRVDVVAESSARSSRSLQFVLSPERGVALRF